MKTKTVKNKIYEGSVYAIFLKSGEYAFAVVCKGGDFAFFDYKSTDLLVPDSLLELPLAFRVPVAKDGPASGNWKLVGNVELRNVYAAPGKYLHKPVGSDTLYIYSAGASSPSNERETKGLEMLATWFSFHIEERLDDYFNGRENKYVMAIKKQHGL